jgi:hypothetical protein
MSRIGVRLLEIEIEIRILEALHISISSTYQSMGGWWEAWRRLVIRWARRYQYVSGSIYKKITSDGCRSNRKFHSFPASWGWRKYYTTVLYFMRYLHSMINIPSDRAVWTLNGPEFSLSLSPRPQPLLYMGAARCLGGHHEHKPLKSALLIEES